MLLSLGGILFGFDEAAPAGAAVVTPASASAAPATEALPPQILAADAAMLDREAEQMAVLAGLARLARARETAAPPENVATEDDRLRAGLLLRDALPLIQADLAASRNSVLAEEAARPARMPAVAPAASPAPAISPAPPASPALAAAPASAASAAPTPAAPAVADARDAAHALTAAVQAKRRTAHARDHAQAELAAAEIEMRRAHRQAAGGDVGRLIGALGHEQQAEAHRREAAARLHAAVLADERQAHLLADLQQKAGRPVLTAAAEPVSPLISSPAAAKPAAAPMPSAASSPSASPTAGANVPAEGADVQLPPFIPGKAGPADAAPVQLASAAADSSAASPAPAGTAASDSAAPGAAAESSAGGPVPRPGQLLAPVSGRIVKRYGAKSGYDTEQGLTLAAQPGARVVAPYGGRIEFAGPFKGYGQILIIDHGGGYHSLVAGMDHVNGAVGQIVTTGEAIGSMGAGTAAPNLYLELRHQGEPINPLPWLAAHDGKVSG